MANKKQYQLTRTGDAPLIFSGELLAAAGDRIHGGQEQNRWHELLLYRTTGGTYVVGIGYKSTWQGESERFEVHVIPAKHPDEIANILRAYPVAAAVRGYPVGGAYAEKQERLLCDLQSTYETLVSDLLAGAGEEFAERVD